MTDPRRTRLLSVDALRAVAVLLVVLVHTASPPADYHHLSRLIHWAERCGDSGVSLFLVISGFSIHRSWSARAEREGAFPFRAFWARRFWRLYPTFWIAAPLCLLVVALDVGRHAVTGARVGTTFTDGSLPWPLFPLSVLAIFLANVWPPPFLGRAWSLALEEQIYLVYSLCFKQVQRLGPWRLLAGAVVLSLGLRVVLLVTVGLHPGPQWRFQLPYAIPPVRCVEWVTGVLVAELAAGTATVRGGIDRVTSLPVIVVPLALAGVLANQPLGGVGFVAGTLGYHLLAAVGFGALLLRLLTRDEGERAGGVVRALAPVGVAAYSVYLVHVPVLQAVEHRVSGTWLLVEPLGWVCSVAAGVAVWWVVERRFVAYGQTRGAARTAVPATSTD